MKSVKSLKNMIPYKEDGNTIHFILEENVCPIWSKALAHPLTTNKLDLKISEKYKNQKTMMTKMTVQQTGLSIFKI